jgi:3-oxoacyl-[acyl-carrier protein] reductase
MSARRCLVFGGSGTVGRAVCEALDAEGAEVFFTHHDGQVVADALRARSPRLHPLRADLRQVSEVERVVDAAVAELGGLDAFVHCAGLGFTAERAPGAAQETIAETSEEAWDRLFAVNVKSAFFAIRRFAPAMEKQGGGEIVLLGSIDGVKPVPAPVHYGASKGALAGMTRTLSKELGPKNVRVNLVAPGVLDGGISSTLPEELKKEYLKHCGLKRFGRPSEVASIVAWLVMHNTYVTGQTILVDGAL